MSDWNPAQYRKFADERAQPIHDLLSLIEMGDIARAVDLGCGPGELTVLVADRTGAGEIVGIDTSPAMLAAAAEQARPGVSFVSGDLGEWTSNADHDLVFANASLHWTPDHRAVLTRWTAALAPGGQLAVQVPANAYMPAHLLADEVARREPYCSALVGEPPPDPVATNVLAPEEYAQLLYDLGFERQHVRLQVYPHVLPSTRHVVEWLRGTALTRFEQLLEPSLYARFLADYEDALLQRVGDHAPYFFPFRRVLMWGRLPR